MSMATGAGSDVHGILETATIQIRAGQQAGFESAMAEAEQIFQKAKGFQKSIAFQHWRDLIGPYFRQIPAVEHMEFVQRKVAAA